MSCQNLKLLLLVVWLTFVKIVVDIEKRIGTLLLTSYILRLRFEGLTS